MLVIMLVIPLINACVTLKIKKQLQTDCTTRKSYISANIRISQYTFYVIPHEPWDKNVNPPWHFLKSNHVDTISCLFLAMIQPQASRVLKASLMNRSGRCFHCLFEDLTKHQNDLSEFIYVKRKYNIMYFSNALQYHVQ